MWSEDFYAVQLRLGTMDSIFDSYNGREVLVPPTQLLSALMCRLEDNSTKYELWGVPRVFGSLNWADVIVDTTCKVQGVDAAGLFMFRSGMTVNVDPAKTLGGSMPTLMHLGTISHSPANRRTCLWAVIYDEDTPLKLEDVFFSESLKGVTTLCSQAVSKLWKELGSDRPPVSMIVDWYPLSTNRVHLTSAANIRVQIEGMARRHKRAGGSLTGTDAPFVWLKVQTVVAYITALKAKSPKTGSGGRKDDKSPKKAVEICDDEPETPSKRKKTSRVPTSEVEEDPLPQPSGEFAGYSRVHTEPIHGLKVLVGELAGQICNLRRELEEKGGADDSESSKLRTLATDLKSVSESLQITASKLGSSVGDLQKAYSDLGEKSRSTEKMVQDLKGTVDGLVTMNKSMLEEMGKQNAKMKEDLQTMNTALVAGLQTSFKESMTEMTAGWGAYTEGIVRTTQQYAFVMT